MVKRQKTLSLSDEVCDRLEQEDNQSELVERLLREEYDL